MNAETIQAATTDSDLGSPEVPLKAPAGTPSPLREAYEAIAQTLFLAAEMHRHPPTARPTFEDQTCRLSSAWMASQECYAVGELLLQAAAADGRCAYQDALNAISRVNEACALVMLGSVPFYPATDHLQAVPAFDETQLIRSMRQQLSRAALSIQARTNRDLYVWEKGQAVDSADGWAQLPLPNTDPPEPRRCPTEPRPSESAHALRSEDTRKEQTLVATEELTAGKLMRQPTTEALAAYRAWLATGMKQTDLAELLTSKLKRPIHQGNISRWIAQVKRWLEAGNVLPDLSASLYRKPMPMDPRHIDLGPRQDRHCARQSERRNSDADD